MEYCYRSVTNNEQTIIIIVTILQYTGNLTIQFSGKKKKTNKKKKKKKKNSCITMKQSYLCYT